MLICRFSYFEVHLITNKNLLEGRQVCDVNNKFCVNQGVWILVKITVEIKM